MKVDAKKMAALIGVGQRIVFLTGAGVSTLSGIPDYRSATGLYTTSGLKEPEYLLSRQAMLHDTDDFRRFISQLCQKEAQPNVIHKKMAKLAKRKDVTVITQNIDGLHSLAGSKKVIEFHGSLANSYCEKCRTIVETELFLKHATHPSCGGILRPDVVLYDEQIPYENVELSLKAMMHADVIVIVGTSFKVYPFASLIDYKNKDATILVVNKEPIYGAQPDWAFYGDGGEVFSLL